MERCEHCNCELNMKVASATPVVYYTEGLEYNKHTICQKCWYNWDSHTPSKIA